MSILKNVIMYLWQLPQNLVGLFLVIALKNDKSHRKNNRINKSFVYYKDSRFGGAISLGYYILIFSKYYYDDMTLISHEYGHCRQSKYLGWLYLPVVGLSSILWAIYYDNYAYKKGKDYCSFWTERWADRLGGVKR